MPVIESEADHIQHHLDLDAKIDVILLQTEATQSQIQRIEAEFTHHVEEQKPIISSILLTLKNLCDELHIPKGE